VRTANEQFEVGRCIVKIAESNFMLKNTPLFFERFSLSYYREDSCIEYFINGRSTSNTISSALILSYCSPQNDLHVSRFHPELYLLPNSKYLSATCFYLLIQHCALVFTLADNFHISLETVQKVSDSFYRKLGDFNFIESKHGLGNVVELISNVNRSTVDTSMIKLHIYQPGEIPFMK
jgi:hypothetical protein